MLNSSKKWTKKCDLTTKGQLISIAIYGLPHLEDFTIS